MYKKVGPFWKEKRYGLSYVEKEAYSTMEVPEHWSSEI